jgi:fermentation-respiration switch protein FrsA (DUF1100 family)
MLKRMLVIIVLFIVALGALAWLVRQLEPRFAFFPFADETITPGQLGAAFTALTIDTADGERLRVWHVPHPTPIAQVLYFHGNGGNLSVWADVVVGLWRERFDVVTFDYRGYGVSTGTPSEAGLYRDVDAVIALLDGDLRRTDVPLIFWGRSLGTAMAAYGARQRLPDGVVLEAGFPSARALFERNPLMYTLSLFATYRFATAEWMSEVKAPALVVHGDRDRVIPYRMGQRLYDGLPGPKRFVTIPGGDHNDPAPADADLYWGAVRDFVTSLGQEAGGSTGPSLPPAR